MSQESLTPLLNSGISEMVGPSKRYGVTMAAVFIVGTICGSGVLAIPQAIVDAGWIGIPLLVICGCLSAYTGTLLGKCWTILQIRYPEYALERVTDPYPLIGFRAAGKVGEHATRFCIVATLFGGATVFLLLIADNITNLMKSIGGDEFYACYMLMIVGCVLIPPSWFGTPKDFWQAGVIAAVTTSIGALLIMVGVIKDAPLHKDPSWPNPSASSFFNSFGTILYSFGGASCFPTIQVDMANPKKFTKAVVIGILVVLSLYLPAGTSGLIVFGSEMKPNVLEALSPGGISYSINILITSHLLMAFIIISNPVTQGIEGFFNVPDRFTWKRVMVRTLYVVSLLFVALSIPHFNIILALVGGSTVTCTNFIFPPLFYYLLSRQKKPEDARGGLPAELDESPPNGYVTGGRLTPKWPQIEMSLHKKVFLYEIILIGVAGGLISTYFAFASLISGASGFTVPCYVDASVG